MIRAFLITAALLGGFPSARAEGSPREVSLMKSGLPLLIRDSPAQTKIDGDFGPLSKTNPPPSVTLQIDWLNQTPAPTDFKTTFKNGIAESTHRLGSTHITRTVLISDGAVFIHFLADKPGDLSFRATLTSSEKGESVIEDRRELAWVSPQNPARKARAWVIPFESDVESDGNSIVLRGEGECLVILDFTATEDPATQVSETWKRISTARDPGENPPDPTKIWHDILAEAVKR